MREDVNPSMMIERDRPRWCSPASMEAVALALAV